MDVAAERARLAGRLEHRLQSSVLLVREAAQRGELEMLDDFVAELSRRARGLARCCAFGPDALAALRDAVGDWMGGDAAWSESPCGFSVRAAAGHQPPEVAELGEPLVRLLAAVVGGEVVAWSPAAVEVTLPG